MMQEVGRTQYNRNFTAEGVAFVEALSDGVTEDVDRK